MFRKRCSQMFFKIIVFKIIVCKFHRKASVLDSSLIKLQALRTATLLKRDSSTGFLLWILWIIQKHLFCVKDLWTAGSEILVRLFKNTFLTELLQWLLLTVSGFQPAALLKKRLQQRRFSVNFASFYRIPPDDCFLCLTVISKSFSDHLFYTAPLGNCLCVSWRISTSRYNKKSFTSAFQAIYTKTRRSYLEAFIYLKSLKIVSEEVNL